jgi:hypothetical protein
MEHDALLIVGDMWAWLKANKPGFVLTDAPHDTICALNKFCEINNLIYINATSRLWLTNERQAQKRAEPYQAIIRAFPEVTTICDPFLGWGATGVAALREGRKFIGIDRLRDRVEFARDWMLSENPATRIHIQHL